MSTILRIMTILKRQLKKLLIVNTNMLQNSEDWSKDSYRNGRNTASPQFRKSETGRDIKKLF